VRAALAVILLLSPLLAAAQPRFDHARTGFLLGAAHQQARCESCHAQGVFGGTPRDCASCHVAGNRTGATARPSRHVPTAQPCDTCHRGAAWRPASFSHAAVAPGSCASCHNNAAGPGKPAGHLQTAASCDACHRTSAWRPAGYSHARVTPGTCASCHNGSSATGKPGSHVATTASCDSCHRTTAWRPASFSHASVAPGTCVTCHNGSMATGKPSNHLATTASCDSCHRTTAWRPASFSHTSVAPGTCVTCHNGSAATGKPSGHFVTTRSCDACHRTTAWTPVAAYLHVSPAYRPHSSGVTCRACHTTNNEVIAWKFAAYKPDCAGCHAERFKPDAHKKVDSPTILYTVAELRDCSGSCHQYTNSTFSQILRTRSGQHRPTGSF
jgi:hypothetical protein